MSYITFTLTMFTLIIKYGLFGVGGFSIDWKLTLLAKVVVLRSTWESSVLTQAGGYCIVGWGLSVPVIIIKNGEIDLAGFWHEVGHVPDIKLMFKGVSKWSILATCIAHCLCNPLNMPRWLVSLANMIAKLRGHDQSETGVQIIADVGFEMRADAFAVSKVGAPAVANVITTIIGNLIGCPSEDVYNTLKSYPQNPNIDVVIQRLDALANL